MSVPGDRSQVTPYTWLVNGSGGTAVSALWRFHLICNDSVSSIMWHDHNETFAALFAPLPTTFLSQKGGEETIFNFWVHRPLEIHEVREAEYREVNVGGGQNPDLEEAGQERDVLVEKMEIAEKCRRRILGDKFLGLEQTEAIPRSQPACQFRQITILECILNCFSISSLCQICVYVGVWNERKHPEDDPCQSVRWCRSNPAKFQMPNHWRETWEAHRDIYPEASRGIGFDF
ncbi:hypothetical protein C8R45DRAFT_927524 [Mycena sanguinolenta]|nr:hypothetical protein C8R45DRAFT_927524 [Mycena sanguinolenta]